VSWEEVERALRKKDVTLLVFEAPQVVARVEKMGDLFAPLNELKQRLPDLKGVAASDVEPAEAAIPAAAQRAERPKQVRHPVARKAVKPQPSRKSKRKL
jgi:hypothetical protein